MNQLKNKLSRIAALVLVTMLIASFNNQPFVFDGGYIGNDRLFISPATMLEAIEPSKAAGCTGAVTYQWQESSDGYNFIDIANATGAKYKKVIIHTTTYLRRKAVCSAGGLAYTNVLSIIVGPPVP